MDKDVKDRVYATIPKVNNKVVVDYKSVLEKCKKHYTVLAKDKDQELVCLCD